MYLILCHAAHKLNVSFLTSWWIEPCVVERNRLSWLSLYFAFEIRLRRRWHGMPLPIIVTPNYSPWVTSFTTYPAGVSGSPSSESTHTIEHLTTFQAISIAAAQVSALSSSASSPSRDLARSGTLANMMSGRLLFGSSGITLRGNESINILYRDGLVTDPSGTSLLKVPTA